MEPWLIDLLAEVDADLAKLGIDPAEVAYSTKRRMAILRRWPDTAVRAADQAARGGDESERRRYDDEVAQIKAAVQKPNPDLAAEKEAMLNVGRQMREVVLGRLNGLHIDAIAAGDTTTAAAIVLTKQQLKDITLYPAVVAAVGAAQTRAAFLARYYEIATELALAAPAAYSAFRSLDT